MSPMSPRGLSSPRDSTAVVFEERHYTLPQLDALADG
ncbi:MAG: hypothetical protein QOH94_706, partial [Mycobacterium sp.]|nr:hypothetical protein [Mycobacterium sp.]